jgi:hypothetical protein
VRGDLRGHNRAGTRLAVAQAHPGASNNDLTDETYLDRLSGNAALNGAPDTVEGATTVSTGTPNA